MHQGPLSDINVPKMLQPKGLYLVRPAMQQYLSTREELDEASKVMFEKISSGKVKIKYLKSINYMKLFRLIKI
jgi:NADPH2:quinone reductase